MDNISLYFVYIIVGPKHSTYLSEIYRLLFPSSETCKIPRVMEGIIHECNDAYSISEEEDGDFGTSWTSRGTSNSRFVFLLVFLIFRT